jgi:hypothetical protein
LRWGATLNSPVIDHALTMIFVPLVPDVFFGIVLSIRVAARLVASMRTERIMSP